ncbi:MAG: ThiF family adenylyltransferase [Rhodospirillaceae bacterium]|nr:ThiF family adenylyltransferase [Rhodospirillaceae bacterium]MDD9998058.1 ThiF family adenylyltransferase [Rhodospirillaceae bacterium]MDE0359835.1 ThiF family adenylyltransferase [Rhodospirillaceae bacterium]
MCPDDRLVAFGEQTGFRVEVEPDVVRAVGVPCLLAGGTVGTCTVEKSCDPANGKPTEQVGGAVHGVRIRPDEAKDGRAYHANGTAIENLIGGDGETWSDISIKKGSQSSPEDDDSAQELVYRYVKQIVGAVSAAGLPETVWLPRPNPFKIPNTFEARAALGPVQDRIRDQRVAIIGLGGTGAYLLDLIAKTPVPEIHLLDGDKVGWHTFMRAPGAPTAEEIEAVRKSAPIKVKYYDAKYDSLRKGIYAHAMRIESASAIVEFTALHPVDFAFVCIDQRMDSDSPRQDHVYAGLSEAGIPFIDSGVSITLEGDAVRGAVTTSYYAAGSEEWKVGIPNAKVEGDLPGYRNVQLPEVNALAASLAVTEWRRRTEQFVSESNSFLHKFRLETPRIVKAE